LKAAAGIRSLEDIRGIEAAPYAGFMPHADVLDALEDAAARHPGRPAITYIRSADPAVPPLRLTHAELAAQVRRAARAFAALCGDEEPRVAFLLPAVPEAYVTLWAAEAVGVACPINYLLGEAHIAELIDAARVNVLVALGPNPELDVWARVPGLRGRCGSLRHVVAVGGAQGIGGALDFDTLLAAQPATPLARTRTPNAGRIAALFHTGGTTGRPKLAQHTHGNQLHAAWGAARMYGTSAHDVVLNGFPLFHVAGSFVYGLSTLLAGGEVVLPTLLGLRNTAFVQAYWRFVALHSVTLLAAVPTVMSTLLGVPRQGEDLSRVRCLLTGGSPLPSELADAFEQKLGIAVRNILGMTECGGVIAIEPAGAPRAAGSVGWPLPFTQVRVADEAGAPLADRDHCDHGDHGDHGEEGILQIRGPNVGPGYTDAANNAGVLLDGGWLSTGDLGRIDAQGRVFVTGRAKDLIIRSSHNIDPVVIEDALMAHPGVLLAAAVGAPDAYAGEVPVAYVSLRPGCEADSAQLAAFAQARIPERPAFPKAIFVLDALPVTAIGKLYKPALRALATRWAVEEHIARSPLARRLRIDVRAEGKGLVVHCTPADDDPGTPAQARELLGVFALTCRFEASDATQGARA
jgi:fatty-acyl-CoA synthase